MKYAKLIDNSIKYPPKNKDGVCNYNLDVERLKADGYKEFIEAEKLPGYQYKVSHTENATQIIEIAEVIKTPEEIKQEEFQHDFFNTSLGYVSREVYLKTGEIKNFLTDIMPRLKVGSPIITYNADGTQNLDQVVTEQFIEECDQQLSQELYDVMLMIK